MDSVDTARALARAAGRGDAGIVRLGYGGATYNRIIPRIVRSARSTYPGIELRLESNLLSGKAFDKVADREIDIGFGRLPGSRFGVRTHLLAKEHLVVALPADHPLATREAIDIKDLRDEVFVAPPASDGSSVRNLLIHTATEAGFAPRVVQEAPDSLTLLSLVAAGVGVTLTLSALQFYEPEGLVFRPLVEEVPVDSVVMWHEANTSRTVHSILRLIIAEAGTGGIHTKSD
ncbi:LysR family substrate-binding domain-containing protein [Rhodococcus sp. NPDC057014]|uniref:LysR family substrate-binding domain-containing protein n=1 Tax=Rhodococcus sp. NPDC057014 TaxID=3346000 RepID=UPI0036440F1C